jgi:exo-1,4-beta-D-glucosaminidase
MKKAWSRTGIINIGADIYTELFRIPEGLNLTPVYFVKLSLLSKTGKVLSENTYWLSSSGKPDFSKLSELEPVALDVTAFKDEKAKELQVEVKLKNNTGKLSFFNRLVISRGENGEEVLPTFWDSNFLILFPGEEKTVKAIIETEDLQGADPYLSIDGNAKVKPVLLKNK